MVGHDGDEFQVTPTLLHIGFDVSDALLKKGPVFRLGLISQLQSFQAIALIITILCDKNKASPRVEEGTYVFSQLLLMLKDAGALPQTILLILS